LVEPAAKTRKQADAQILRSATQVLSEAVRTTLARPVPSYKLAPIEFSWISDMEKFANWAVCISSLNASASPSTISPAIEIATVPSALARLSITAPLTGNTLNMASKAIRRLIRTINPPLAMLNRIIN
jgi:hypothetical protein